LDLAQSAFTWLETHAHDELHGGYFVFYRQDGTPILSSNDPSQIRDAIGTPIGFKDANTTSDLLKCFYDLYRVWPDALLRRRVEELLCIVRDRLVVAPGVMHLYASADWTPVPDLVRYGQILRSANHLLAASEAISGGTIDSTTARVVKSMADTMLRIAWDPDQGGFHLAGSSFGPTSVENRIIFVRDKFWWPQTEGLKLLLWMAQLHPTDVADYFAQFARLWEYIKRYLIDPRHGGWFAAGLDTNPEARKRPKATIWKDCSHEVESLIDCLLIIKSL